MSIKKRASFVFAAILLLLTVFAANNSQVSSKPFSADRFLEIEKFADADLREMSVKAASIIDGGRFAKKSETEKLADAELVAARYAKLLNAVEQNPAEVLRAALPPEILAQAPPEFAGFLEKPLQTNGTLTVVYECDGVSSDIKKYFLKTAADERLELRFTEKPDRELLTDAPARIKGIRLGDKAVLEPKNLEAADSLAVLPNTFGEQKILILLVNFQNDLRQPFTINQVNDLVFNSQNGSSVTNFYREASFGQTWVTGQTYGWFTLNMTDGCDYARIAANAKSAAQNAGVNLSAYNRYMYIYPATACGYSGLGTLGGNEVWINGTLTRQNLSHELGHNFGLHHARFLDCGSVVLGSDCTTIEYGHIMDTVGGGSGHFHSFHKERLGWLNYGSMPAVTEVTASGNYSIAPYAANTGAATPKALKILKSIDANGRKTWYYVELRRNYGFDSGISSNVNLMNGVMINLNRESNPQENYMLDLTPETTTRSDPALTVNRTYTDASAGISITPLSVGDGGAIVNVSFGSAPPAPCVLANPTISVTPSATQWIGAGSSVTYSVTVKNNNASNCSNNSFNVQPTLANGWSAVVAAPVLNINPGASATTAVQVFAPNSAPDGFYSIGIAVVNSSSPSYSASVSASCAVYSALSVSAAPGQASYARTQTAVINASVAANGSPITGAIVTFTMTKANGAVVTATAASNADGSAAFNYKFNKKLDPAGIYTVRVNANLNGVTGTGSTSFEVR
jgi:hypothetical protein